jgi:hypothetical protein
MIGIMLYDGAHSQDFRRFEISLSEGIGAVSPGWGSALGRDLSGAGLYSHYYYILGEPMGEYFPATRLNRHNKRPSIAITFRKSRALYGKLLYTFRQDMGSVSALSNEYRTRLTIAMHLSTIAGMAGFEFRPVWKLRGYMGAGVGLVWVTTEAHTGPYGYDDGAVDRGTGLQYLFESGVKVPIVWRFHIDLNARFYYSPKTPLGSFDALDDNGQTVLVVPAQKLSINYWMFGLGTGFCF